MQLEAIKKNPFTIQYVENQCEKCKEEAVRRNPTTIEYVENPSEEICILAVKSLWNALKAY